MSLSFLKEKFVHKQTAFCSSLCGACKHASILDGTSAQSARVTSKRPHVQNLTHFSDHEEQPETPGTAAVVPSDASDTHFARDASIDVYKYGHSKRIYIDINGFGRNSDCDM